MAHLDIRRGRVYRKLAAAACNGAACPHILRLCAHIYYISVLNSLLHSVAGRVSHTLALIETAHTDLKHLTNSLAHIPMVAITRFADPSFFHGGWRISRLLLQSQFRCVCELLGQDEGPTLCGLCGHRFLPRGLVANLAQRQTS